MGDEPDTWVDRLKRRPLVAALIATAVALGGVEGDDSFNLIWSRRSDT
jgi:hypothetical protein